MYTGKNRNESLTGPNPGYCLLLIPSSSHFIPPPPSWLLIPHFCLPQFPNLANLVKLYVWSLETTNVHPAGVLFKLYNGKISLWTGVCVCFWNIHTVYLCCMCAYHAVRMGMLYMLVYVCMNACFIWNIPVDYCFVYVLLPQQAWSLGSYICKHHALRSLHCACVCVSEGACLCAYVWTRNLRR